MNEISAEDREKYLLIYLEDETTGKTQTFRTRKGKSLIAFPDAYTVIDIETTGLSPEWDEIIELSAIRYRGGAVAEEFSTLVRPESPINPFITALTGITNEMVADAPSIDDCIGAYADFIGDEMVVGYNVNFDINFIYDKLAYLGIPFPNNFVDIMRIARRDLTELPHHRMADIAAYFEIPVTRAHRSLDDCKTCKACFDALREHIIAGGLTLENFVANVNRSYSGLKAKDIVAEEGAADPDNPLYGKVCVFTGTLDKMKRADAMQLVANLGGIPADGVTKKTNYLILGNNDYCSSIKDGKSNKQKKAEDLILKGADLQVIPEQVFYDMISEE